MRSRLRKTASLAMFVAVAILGVGAATEAQNVAGTIRLDVDSTRAPQKILHSHLEMPVQPGALVLSYPEWIPGEHQPTGPIINVAGLKITANGRLLNWRRDPIDMFAVHLDVPRGTSALDIDFDFLLSSDAAGYSSAASATAFLNVISWNQLVMFAKGTNAANLTFSASLRLPAGWKFGTALPVAKREGDRVDFAPVSLEMLIDSPVLTGRYFRAIDLTPGQTPHVELDIAADSAAALEMPAETEAHYHELVAQEFALFQSRHYRDYHFLVSLSDNVAHFGLEHHESSDDRLYERSFTDETRRTGSAYLLPHEYTHSWNGKYRRPEDLLSPDYHQPMQDDLLWVYEGLTEYLAEVLTARSGLWTQEQDREDLARVGAMLDNEPGREWRPLQDTADSAVFLYDAKSNTDWANWRRGTDFYEESIYLWLDVDGTIRRLTNGRKSLEDFCRLFYGGTTGVPDLKTYNFDDVVTALSEVTPYDWAVYLRTRLDSVATNTPDESLHNSGWRIVYNDQPNEIETDHDKMRKKVDFSLSIGLRLSADGSIDDAVYDGPCYKAGIGPGMKVLAVNGAQTSDATLAQIMSDAITEAKNSTASIQLLIANGVDVETHAVDYHAGLRYPHLVRDETQPDMLTKILTPLAK